MFEIIMMATRMDEQFTDIDVVVYEKIGNINKKNVFSFRLDGVYKSITPELEEAVRQVLIDNNIIEEAN